MYISQVNGLAVYLIVGAVLLLILAMAGLFLLKSYKAGIEIGMDKKILKRAVTSSITFTLLPSISILLGVIALSGTLGVPFSWLRLSVIGSLQYELNVAEIAANAVGLNGLKVSEMSMEAFSTIALVMTAGILGGVLCAIFFLKPYLKRMQGNSKAEADGENQDKPKKSFGAVAVTAMFIGLCSAYIGSYVGTLTSSGDYIPLLTAGVAALIMAVFEYFTVVRKKAWLDNFSVATSMLGAMAAAVIFSSI